MDIKTNLPGHSSAVLLSLTSTLFVLLILAGCGSNEVNPALPNKVNIHLLHENAAERDIIVERNMAEIQTAVEHYAADHGIETYPDKLDDTFKSYFPGGEENRVATQVGLINPFSAEFEFPIFSNDKKNSDKAKIGTLPELRNAEDLKQMRTGKRFPLKRGVILIFPISGGYAIVGGAHDDRVLMDKQNNGQVLVLSNIDWPTE